MDYLSAWTVLAQSSVLAFWGALGFYFGLLLLGLSARVRQAFVRIFQPAVPSSMPAVAVFDSFRGLAALWVVSFHAWQWSGPHSAYIGTIPYIIQGNKAVPVFMVLSGFLVYGSIRGRALSRTVLLGYLRRRALRIYPLYAATVIALAAAGYFPWGPDSLGRLGAEVLMLRSLAYPGFVNPPAWSLYVEVAFYLALPFWVVVCRRHPMAFATVAFVGLSLLPSRVPREVALVKYLFLGIAACEFFHHRGYQRVGQLLGGLLFGMGAGALWWDLNRGDVFGAVVNRSLGQLGLAYQVGHPDYSVLLGVAMVLLLLGSARFGPARAALQIYPLRFLGVISYGLYMWHSFIITTGTAIRFNGVGGLAVGGGTIPEIDYLTFLGVYLPAFVFWASASYALIERPFQRLRNVRSAVAPARSTVSATRLLRAG